MTKRVMKCLTDLRGGDQPEHAEYLERGGEDYETFRAPDWLWPLLLIGKLHEEVEEVRESMTDLNEYADVTIALRSLAEANGLTQQQIDDAVVRRLDLKGPLTLGKVMRRL